MRQKIKRYERAQNHKILKSASRQSSSRKEDNVEQRQQTKSLTEENDSLKVQVASLTAEVASLTAEVELLKADAGTQVSALQKEVQLLKDRPMSVDFIKGDDKRTKFYTGLTTFFLFTTIFDFVVPQVLMLQKMPGKLTLMDEFLMVLMKLRLNLLNEDLGYRFGVASSTVSRNFHKWLEVMYMRLKPMIRWPDKETVHKTLPNCFKKHYFRVRCIVDCTEVFIERPTCLRALTLQKT